MREILFRGKEIRTGEWVYGYYYSHDFVREGETKPYYTDHRIRWQISNRENIAEKVDPETVGQYTGLTDKNCKKIFEDDIISKNGVIIRIVEWEEWSTGFFPFNVIEDGGRAYVDAYECEVIGNIHDNPELLKFVK